MQIPESPDSEYDISTTGGQGTTPNAKTENKQNSTKRVGPTWKK